MNERIIPRSVGQIAVFPNKGPWTTKSNRELNSGKAKKLANNIHKQTKMGGDKMPKTKEKKVIESIKEMPTLRIRCPGCNEILCAKEVKKTNSCSAESCGYIFPYPVAKALKVEALLNNPETTYGELSNLILNMLDLIDNRDTKAAFLGKVIRLVQENHEQRLVQRKQ